MLFEKSAAGRERESAENIIVMGEVMVRHWLSKEAAINGDNIGQLAQVSLPSQLVLKGRGSIHRQPAGMYKAQQRHRMKAPVHGAAHSLSLQSVSTFVCSSLP